MRCVVRKDDAMRYYQKRKEDFNNKSSRKDVFVEWACWI
jgi:hypothetical protein